jgi:GST-like protein
MIDLHYTTTPNGLKIAIMLAETQLAHRVIVYDIFAGDHLRAAFKRINPNHKLPAIVDHAPADGGEPFAVFESGAILLYLARKTDQLLPRNFRRQNIALQWLTWQVAGLGPMIGQAAHFVRYAPEGNDYGCHRYVREVHRLLSVLDHRLGQEEFLATEYSIADIACWPVVQNVHNFNIDTATAYPHVQRWSDAVRARPAVQAASSSSTTGVPGGYTRRRMALTPEQWSNMFGDNMHGAVARD